MSHKTEVTSSNPPSPFPCMDIKKKKKSQLDQNQIVINLKFNCILKVMLGSMKIEVC
jgi:hypothetical protein